MHPAGADHVDAAVAIVVEGHQHRRVLAVGAGDVEVRALGGEVRDEAVEAVDVPEPLERGLDQVELEVSTSARSAIGIAIVRVEES